MGECFTEGDVFSNTGEAETSSIPKRILLLEDDRTLLGLLAMYLREAGHFVSATDDVSDALQSIGQSPWDLVITDGALPTSSGEEFAQQVTEQTTNLPLLLITGSARAVKNGSLFSGILRKPFFREDFLQMVRKTLA